MKLLTSTLLLCLLLPATAALGQNSPPAADVPFELRGVTSINGKVYLAISDKAADSTSWIGLGDTVNGVQAAGYDEKREVVTINKGGASYDIALSDSSIAEIKAAMAGAAAVTAPSAGPAAGQPGAPGTTSDFARRAMQASRERPKAPRDANGVILPPQPIDPKVGATMGPRPPAPGTPYSGPPLPDPDPAKRPPGPPLPKPGAIYTGPELPPNQQTTTTK